MKILRCAMLIGSLLVASAQRAQAEPQPGATLAAGSVVWRADVARSADGRLEVLVTGGNRATPLRIALPLDAEAESPQVSLERLTVQGGREVVGLTVAAGIDAEQERFAALIALPTRAGAAAELLWRSGRRSASTDLPWMLVDADGDGRTELVLPEADARLGTCAGELVLHPVTVSRGGLVPLRRASLRPTGAPQAKREGSVVRDRFGLDGAVSWVSHADSALGSVNAIAALHDEREETVWAPSRDNPAGEFAVLRMVDGIALTGLTVGLRNDSAEASLLLHFGGERRTLSLKPGSTVTVAAPAAASGGCTAVEVLSKRGSAPLLVSTLRPVSELDTQPVDAIFNRVLLPILKRVRDSGERSAVIRWLGEAGPSLLPHLDRAIRDELGDRQSVLVLTALAFEGGDELLAHLAVEGVLEAESIATWSRANRKLSEAALTIILAQFSDGAPDVRLFPLVARTQAEAGDRAFITLLRSPSAVVRREAMDALPPNAPGLLATVLEEAETATPDERSAWLATALRLARHQRALEAGPTGVRVEAAVGRLLASAQSAERRVGVTLAGVLALSGRRSAVEAAAADGEDEWLRVSALEALARWRGADAAARASAEELLAKALRDGTPSVRMAAAAVLAREPKLRLPASTCLDLLREESWSETRASLLQVLVRETEAGASDIAALVRWLAAAPERERLAFLDRYRSDADRADDAWLELDETTRREPSARRALLFALGRTLSPAQQRFAEAVADDRLETDEVRLAAATVLARGGSRRWRGAATDLLRSENAAAAQRAAELLCAWTPETERASLSDEQAYPSEYAVVRETLATCRETATDPVSGQPLKPR